MKRTHPANVFVCECITQSLFRLMKRKAYNKITVTDLVREAGVSRNSFYRLKPILDAMWNWGEEFKAQNAC